ncbi:hypothetical protein B0H13DRAFT_1887486 [Mycena leptocephala]|nr:hypothetical protein B0H13DRAFT_1887486 [Mycena leptocephala]
MYQQLEVSGELNQSYKTTTPLAEDLRNNWRSLEGQKHLSNRLNLTQKMVQNVEKHWGCCNVDASSISSSPLQAYMNAEARALHYGQGGKSLQLENRFSASGSGFRGVRTPNRTYFFLEFPLSVISLLSYGYDGAEFRREVFRTDAWPDSSGFEEWSQCAEMGNCEKRGLQQRDSLVVCGLKIAKLQQNFRQRFGIRTRSGRVRKISQDANAEPNFRFRFGNSPNLEPEPRVQFSPVQARRRESGPIAQSIVMVKRLESGSKARHNMDKQIAAQVQRKAEFRNYGRKPVQCWAPQDPLPKQYHIFRFRPNALPAARPGHLNDDVLSEIFSRPEISFKDVLAVSLSCRRFRALLMPTIFGKHSWAPWRGRRRSFPPRSIWPHIRVLNVVGPDDWSMSLDSGRRESILAHLKPAIGSMTAAHTFVFTQIWGGIWPELLDTITAAPALTHLVLHHSPWLGVSRGEFDFPPMPRLPRLRHLAYFAAHHMIQSDGIPTPITAVLNTEHTCVPACGRTFSEDRLLKIQRAACDHFQEAKAAAARELESAPDGREIYRQKEAAKQAAKRRKLNPPVWNPVSTAVTRHTDGTRP